MQEFFLDLTTYLSKIYNMKRKYRTYNYTMYDECIYLENFGEKNPKQENEKNYKSGYRMAKLTKDYLARCMS